MKQALQTKPQRSVNFFSVSKKKKIQDNNVKELINIQNSLTNLELKLIQKTRSQEIKINNLNRNSRVLQNEIEAIQRGLCKSKVKQITITNEKFKQAIR